MPIYALHITVPVARWHLYLIIELAGRRQAKIQGHSVGSSSPISRRDHNAGM